MSLCWRNEVAVGLALQALFLMTLGVSAAPAVVAEQENIEPIQPIQLFGRGALSFSRVELSGDDGVLGLNPVVTTNQQSLRIMASQRRGQGYWSVQTVWGRSELGAPGTLHPFFAGGADQITVTEQLRHRAGAGTLFRASRPDETVEVRYWIDRAFYQYDWDALSFKVGRQAIDFGLGRLWQPLNVFGAFTPRALDTDYKPGVDAVRATWFSGISVEATIVHTVGRTSAADATAVMTRNALGEHSQLLGVVASLPGGMVYGAGLETEWSGWGLRLEASYGKSSRLYAIPFSGVMADRWTGFWVLGADRQFGEDSTVTVEWYRHGAGAASLAEFETLQRNASLNFNARGTRSPLRWTETTRQVGARDQFGLALTHSLTPLIQAQGLLIVSRLWHEPVGKYRYAVANQLSLLASLSDESDLLLSLFKGTGLGVRADGLLQSDYGHIPLQINLRWRQYF
jgi:hypothetical protein